MAFLYPLLFVGLLAVIIYQDFRYRALSVFLLMGTLLLVIANSAVVNGWRQALIYTGINALFVAFQLLGVTAYFSMKHRAFTNIINTYLGSGDLWFYGVLVCSFSPLNFVIFNLLACLVILVVYAIAGFRVGESRTIPFAGGLALGMMLVVLTSQVFNVIKPYDDWGLTKMLF